MNKNLLKPLLAFGICVVLTLGCAALASFFQTGCGTVEVQTGFFTPDTSDAANGLPVRIAYKLYKPKDADAAHPAPAVLVMHVYQNDKETSAAVAI